MSCPTRPYKLIHTIWTKQLTDCEACIKLLQARTYNWATGFAKTVEKLAVDFVLMHHPSTDHTACSSKMSSYMTAHSSYNMCNFSQMEAHLADDCWKAENKEAACAFKPIKKRLSRELRKCKAVALTMCLAQTKWSSQIVWGRLRECVRE